MSQLVKILVQHPPLDDESLDSVAAVALADVLAELLVERGYEASSASDPGLKNSDLGLLLQQEGPASKSKDARRFLWSFDSVGATCGEKSGEHDLRIVLTKRQYDDFASSAEQAVALLELHEDCKVRDNAVYHALYLVRAGAHVGLMLAPLLEVGTQVRGMPRASHAGPQRASEWLDYPRNPQQLIHLLRASRNLLLEADVDGSLDCTANRLAVLAQLLGCRVAVIGSLSNSVRRPTKLPVFCQEDELLSFLAAKGESADENSLLQSLIALLESADRDMVSEVLSTHDDKVLDHGRFLAAQLDARLADSEAKRVELIERLRKIDSAWEALQGTHDAELGELASYALALERRSAGIERGFLGRTQRGLRRVGNILFAAITGRQSAEDNQLMRPALLEQFSGKDRELLMRRPAGLVSRPGGSSRRWAKFLPAFVIARLRAAMRTAKQTSPGRAWSQRGTYNNDSGTDAEYWRLQALFTLEELEHERGLRGSPPSNEEDGS